ncbi:putative disease resistance protein [Rosa sericea]
MEIATGTATNLIGKIFGYVGSTVGRQVGYLIHYKRNLGNLETEVSKLSVAKETVSEKITSAKARGEMIHSHVQDWLKNVAKITKEAEELLKDKQQATTEDTNNPLKDDGQPKTTCVHGFCPNPMLRRRRSKNSLALIEGVTKLINEERELSEISYVPPKDLQTEVDKLGVAKRTVAEKVTAAEAKGEKIHAKVQDWLKRVAVIIKEAEEFLKDKHQTIQDGREFMEDEIQAIEKPNTSSHGSKNSLALVEGVTRLINEEIELSDISYVLPAEDECITSDEVYEEFDSRTSILEKILKELGNSSSEMILVYGVGGVGKTTLVEEVLRKTQKEKFFEDAVMVRDVKIPNLEAIQNQIAEKLGLSMVEIKTPSGRANKINERIKDKKTLVIFDDVWGEIDLKAVGLPHRSTCRILLTSRSQQVFFDKIKQKEFQLGVLDDKEAWALFEKKAGDVVADPTIQTVATQVAKKCGGLPVLVITVARALENKPLSIWKDALRRLEKFDEEGDLTEKAYLGIEWSYKQLSVKDQLQPLFLLCGLIAKGNYVSFTDLLKYSIGLGFFEDYTVEDARNALYQQVDKLKSSCLLLDGDDGICVRMHDLVRDVANRIACRDHHVLVEDGGHERKKWPNEDFFIECSKICLPCCNIATLPQVPWKCPKLEMFHLRGEDYDSEDYGDSEDDDDREDDDDSSPNIPSNFFVETKKLKVLGLCNVPLLLLPPSVSFLKNLQTLCLDGCMFEDIALVGELRNLEVLSLVKSKVEQLPKEFGQLTRLRLVDLSDCYGLEVIPAGVISNWTRLEDLRMRNSFDNWESQRWPSNASLLELMNLPKLTALEVLISDPDILPAKFFSDRLEKYQIFIQPKRVWQCSTPMHETTLNKLLLELTTGYDLDQVLKELLKRCGDLRFIGTKDVDFSFIMKTEVVMSSLTTLEVSNCDGLKYLLSSSMARSLVKLKQLKISSCKAMEEIVSTRESQNNIIYKLEILELYQLPNLARFCTAGSCIEFPSLERLYMQQCSFRLGESTAKDTTFRREIQERDENFHAHNETSSQNFLFDEKIRSPRLEILTIINLYYENRFLQTIWHNQLDPGSFCRLREVYVDSCVSLRSIFPPSMTGRLSALETIDIKNCESMEVVFDEHREANVNETRGTSTTQLKDGQNLKSVDIYACHRLKYIFPASMVTRGLQQLQKMGVFYCDEMESVVAKEEGTLESTRHPNFVFPKVESMIFISMQRLKSFYPGMYISEWPLLKYFKFEGEVEIFAAELSVFQERQMHAPTKQPFLLIDKGSFPVLEKLEVSTAEILYGPSSSPVESIFSRLKYMHFWLCKPCLEHAAVLFLQKLPNLEVLKLYKCMPKIFVDERNGCGETVRVGSLPRVRVLELRDVDVRHLGIENQPAGPVFPNLESLNVSDCYRLENLASSPVSFQNLTKLEVYRCDGLKCLAPFSVAKSLVQLTNLKVTHCKEIVVLVAGNEDEDEDDDTENEIAFSRLQYLKLYWLQSLQGFCSRNCSVKLPLSITVDVINCPIQLKISPHGVPIAESLNITNEDGDADGDEDEDADGDGDADGMKMEMEIEDTVDDDHSTVSFYHQIYILYLVFQIL